MCLKYIENLKLMIFGDGDVVSKLQTNEAAEAPDPLCKVKLDWNGL